MKYLRHLKRRAANLPAAPEKPGHYAVMSCTFGGGHTGFGEALPLLKYMGQAFEHEGIRVVEAWPVVGVFPEIDDPSYNTAGRLGDVTGRPNKYDLGIVAGQTCGLLRRLKLKLGTEDALTQSFESHRWSGKKNISGLLTILPRSMSISSHASLPGLIGGTTVHVRSSSS